MRLIIEIIVPSVGGYDVLHTTNYRIPPRRGKHFKTIDEVIEYVARLIREMEK